MVQTTLDQLYKVFGRYPLRQPIGGCPCCSSPVADLLHRKPLRSFCSDDLRRDAFKAMTTVGDVEDIRHFLRGSSKYALGDPGHLGDLGHQIACEVVLGKLAYGKWTRPRRLPEVLDRYMPGRTGEGLWALREWATISNLTLTPGLTPRTKSVRSKLG